MWIPGHKLRTLQPQSPQNYAVEQLGELNHFFLAPVEGFRVQCEPPWPVRATRLIRGPGPTSPSTLADGILARREASAKIGTLSSAFFELQSATSGSSTALADVSRANAEISLGDTSYSNADFDNARTHYSNALNLANSAVNALSSTGGGVDTASYTSMWMSGIGFLLAGVGVVLAGIGGFLYLNRRSKTQTMPKA